MIIHHRQHEDNECSATKSIPEESPIGSEKQFQLTVLSKSGMGGGGEGGILTTYKNQALRLWFPNLVNYGFQFW